MWFSKPEPEPKPELPPIEAKSWFSELPLDYNNGRVTNHLTFLQKYGNNQVKQWSKLFADCMEDIGRNYTDKNKYKSVKNEFLDQSGYENQQDALNEMTKKDFVLLFTKIMTPIIENEQLEQEQREQEKQELDENGCKPNEVYDSYSHNCVKFDDRLSNGGSNKKSYKYARRNRRRSRRNATRKYKKINKR